MTPKVFNQIMADSLFVNIPCPIFPPYDHRRDKIARFITLFEREYRCPVCFKTFFLHVDMGTVGLDFECPWCTSPLDYITTRMDWRYDFINKCDGFGRTPIAR